MLAADSALVAGAMAPAAVRTARIRVARPFAIAAQRHEVGELLELDWRLAEELVTARKAEHVSAEEAAPVQPDLPQREQAAEAELSAATPDERGAE